MLAQTLIKLTLISVMFRRQLEMLPGSDPYGTTSAEGTKGRYKLHFRIGGETESAESKIYYLNKDSPKELIGVILTAINESFKEITWKVIEEVNKIASFISPP